MDAYSLLSVKESKSGRVASREPNTFSGKKEGSSDAAAMMEKSMPTTISGWAKTGRERFKRCWIDFPSSRACISSFCQESYVQKSSCRNEKTADTLLLTAIETGAGSSSGSSSVQRRKRELLSFGREEREPICSSVQRKTRCAVAAEPV